MTSNKWTWSQIVTRGVAVLSCIALGTLAYEYYFMGLRSAGDMGIFTLANLIGTLIFGAASYGLLRVNPDKSNNLAMALLVPGVLSMALMCGFVTMWGGAATLLLYLLG